MRISSAHFCLLTAARILSKIKERVRNLQLQNAKQRLLANAGQPVHQVREGTIHQQLDHFNRLDGRTFPQVEEDQTNGWCTFIVLIIGVMLQFCTLNISHTVSMRCLTVSENRSVFVRFSPKTEQSA